MVDVAAGEAVFGRFTARACGRLVVRVGGSSVPLPAWRCRE